MITEKELSGAETGVLAGRQIMACAFRSGNYRVRVSYESCRLKKLDVLCGIPALCGLGRVNL